LRKVPSISVVNKTEDERMYEIRYVSRFDLKGFEKRYPERDFIFFSGYIPEFVNAASQRVVNIDMGIFK
jgi:hypothetical protein